MVLFLTFVISAVISIALIPILMRYASFLQLLDEPGDRKIHEVAIPHCGGLGLASGAITAIFLYASLDNALLSLIGCSIIIILFGVVDDRFELNYKWKFFGQLLAVIGVMYSGVYISLVPLLGLEPGPLYITLPLTVVFAIGVINAVNLSDGLDGLAAGIMLMTYAVIAFLAMGMDGLGVTIIALAVAGGIVGFLWFNIHPAVVFMGDTGSQFIGFIAVFLSVYLTQIVNQALNPALPLLLLGLPILDTLTVMVRRIRIGRSPFSPDKTHIHHRLMEHGFSHAEAVGLIYVLQSIFLASALFFRYASDFVVIGTFLAISASILLFFFWASKAHWKVHAYAEGANKRGLQMWRSVKLFHLCRHYINYSLAIFLVTQLYCLLDRILDMSNKAYLLVFAGLLLFYLLPKIVQDLWVRIGVYLSAIFASVMKYEYPEMEIHTHWAVDVFLVILIIVVSFAIRMTRKSKFRLTTQDVLVVLFVIASILLIDNILLEHVIFRLFCLVYALEYLLQRDIYRFKATRYTAALSGVLICAIVLPTLINV